MVTKQEKYDSTYAGADGAIEARHCDLQRVQREAWHPCYGGGERAEGDGDAEPHRCVTGADVEVRDPQCGDDVQDHPAHGAAGAGGRGMRIAVLTGLVYALGMVAMFLIFCEPVEDSEHWLLDLMLSKAGAVLAGWGAWRLSKKL